MPIKVRIALVSELARASGLGGMAGGQMLDLAAEGRFEQKRSLTEKEIATLQAMKTGALIRFACRAGAILGQADAAALDSVDRYGTAVGKAFQIADDLLDVEGDAKTLGKAAGKDAAAGKATLVSALGIDGARARLKDLVAQADAALAPFGAKADTLRARPFRCRANDLTTQGNQQWPARLPRDPSCRSASRDCTRGC